MGFSCQFSVLMWKTWTLHRRHYVVTALQILLPLSFALGFVYLNFTWNDTSQKRIAFDDIIFDNEKPLWDGYQSMKLFYSPNSTIVTKLMQRAFSDFDVDLEGRESEDSIESFANSVESKLLSRDQYWAAVIFTNINFNGTPVLHYKLRFPSSATLVDSTDRDSNKTYYDNIIADRLSELLHYYPYAKKFTWLQLKIDLEFISLQQEEKGISAESISIDLQKMPVPKVRGYDAAFSFFFLIPLVIGGGFIFICPIIVFRILEEKNIGAKEMMKMMGMSSIKYWGSTFLCNFLVMAINSVLITILFSISFKNETSVLQDTSPVLFFAILLLFYASSLLFSFAVTTLFNKTSAAVIFLTLLGILSLFIGFLLQSMELTLLAKVLSCLLPNVAFYWVKFIITDAHTFANGSQWSTILAQLYGSTDSFCMGMVLGMMLISCILYSILLWYLDAVWPWQYGVPKPPLFCLSQQCCSLQEGEMMPQFEKQNDSTYMEEEPSDLNPSIVISHLTKVFKVGRKRTKAVDNLSLNIYPRQITAFLGHNGAGKTTVMNMLTGIFPPTNGTVFINGHNIVSETEAARSNLALCPQHNVLYDTLTVQEHFKLFAGLKGMPGSEMDEEIRKLLEQFELQDKRNTMSRDLSLGMKRKLSLGNAIIGGSKVLILDEPTTGLDPESRHAIWDIIQKLRSDHTILLSTHYMEEADALGDRIAIIGNGTLQCSGSPLYLKRRFGDGYHLHIEKGRNCQVDDITNIVLRHVPEAKLLSNANHELLFSLSSESKQFDNLFKDIETFSSDLGILSHGVTVTTMDDVFMNVGEKIENQLLPENDDVSFIECYHDEEILNQGCSNSQRPRLTRQMKALFFKRFHYSKRHILFSAFQAIIPLIAFAIFLNLKIFSEENKRLSYPELAYDLETMFNDTKFGFYEIEGNETKNITSLANYYINILRNENVAVSKVENATYYLLENGRKDVYQYIKKYVVGSSFQESNDILRVTAWYNGIHYHLVTITINLVTNALLQYITHDTFAEIQISSQKFSSENITTPQTAKEAFDMLNLLINTFVFSLGLAFFSATFMLFPVYERASKAKLLQVMCGISGTIHCMVNMFWDFVMYISCCLLILIPFFIYHGYNEFIAFDSIGAIFICLVLYGLASLSFTYLLSYFLMSPSAGFITSLIMNCLFGVIVLPVMIFWKWVEPFNEFVNAVFWIMRLLPTFSATFGIYNIHNIAISNMKCFSLEKNQHVKECIVGMFRTEPYCCSSPMCNIRDFHRPSYLSFEDDAGGKECLSLAISAIVCFLIILVLEQKPFKILHVFKYNLKAIRKKQHKLNGSTVCTVATNEDNNVTSECKRIENLLHLNAVNEEALVVSNLTKYFGSLAAVNELTFGVHNEECFGLLGVNGAGKTTTFRMLVGEIIPSKGNAFIGDSSIQHKIHKFRLSIGYCPQVDSFLDALSGRETLEMFANLRGVDSSSVKNDVNKLMIMCGLDKVADKPARSYSGGTKRKLSLAIAIIGQPSVVLLDEPSAGVDPASRRKLWKTLLSMKTSTGMSFILTSHSMDECEALCDRIAIMAKGEFCCVGSMQNLKAKFGQGYTLVVKVFIANDRNSSRLQEIKAFIRHFFPTATLKLEIQGTLYYQITDICMKFSYMFSVMEKAKQKFQLEDYMLYDNPLEQTFLACTQKESFSNVESTAL